MRNSTSGDIFYIRSDGDLFVQITTEWSENTSVVVHRPSHSISGQVIRKTKTGYVLTNWKINSNERSAWV